MPVIAPISIHNTITETTFIQEVNWPSSLFFCLYVYAVVMQHCVNSNRHKKQHSHWVCGWENSCDGKTLIFPGKRAFLQISQNSKISCAKLVLHHSKKNYVASLGLLQNKWEQAAFILL